MKNVLQYLVIVLLTRTIILAQQEDFDKKNNETSIKNTINGIESIQTVESHVIFLIAKASF